MGKELESRAEALEDKAEALEDKAEVLEDKAEVLEDKVEALESKAEVLENNVKEDKEVQEVLTGSLLYIQEGLTPHPICQFPNLKLLQNKLTMFLMKV